MKCKWKSCKLWGERIYRSDPKLNDNKYGLPGVSDKKKTTFFLVQSCFVYKGILENSPDPLRKG